MAFTDMSSELLFVYDVSINVNTTPVGDVALLAADADSALCDCSPFCPLKYALKVLQSRDETGLYLPGI
ncbi:MAG: hypothetical protein MJY74_06240 [Bacteroidaceae bacterium]|nr:hypothetical protein [Bacteroidaceae bacterium]